MVDAPYRVYILRLGKYKSRFGLVIDGGWYVGMTSNMQERLRNHIFYGGAPATKRFGVEYLVASIPCDSKFDALDLEKEIAHCMHSHGMKVHGGGILTSSIEEEILRML